MIRLAVVWVGNRPERAWEQLAEEYEGRLRRLAELSVVRVRPEVGREGDRRRALAREAEQIARHLRPDDHLVALDEAGEQRSSEDLAGWLGERGATARLAFVLGSDLGLDGALRERARERLSLSRLTLPHLLARLVLLEQLYRALDIASGGSYHRRRV